MGKGRKGDRTRGIENESNKKENGKGLRWEGVKKMGQGKVEERHG